jgi:hypothetical protein
MRKFFLQQYRHLADKTTAPGFVAYWNNNGQVTTLGLNKYAANDSNATMAVHCGNNFDAGFSPYQSTRLSRYNAVS